MSKKKIVLIILCFILCTFLFIIENNKHLSVNETAYYIVYSDMLKKDGGMLGIDKNGEETERRTLSIQDISRAKYIEETFIAGGGRSNNNIFIDKDNNINEFYLLGNSDYSGVTAITIHNKDVYAVMNGNIADNTYKNLFVVQDLEGNVLVQHILDIYAADIIIDADAVYIVGGFYNLEKDEWFSKIIKCDRNGNILLEKIYDKDSEYKEIVIYEDKLYCIISDMNGRSQEVDILSKDSLEKIGCHSFSEEIGALCTDGEYIYIILDDYLCKIDSDLERRAPLYQLSKLSYANGCIVSNNHLYIFMRNNDKVRHNGKVELGYIVDYDILKDSGIETKLYMREKGSDNIVFFPANVINQ